MDHFNVLVVAALLAGCSASAADVEPAVESNRIEAAPETWTWVEFPDAVCADGSATGIGVNVTDRSNDLFVYFMGGGACWDARSCLVLRTAANTGSGYGEDRFVEEPKLDGVSFDRDHEGNPFRDMSYVFMPYCTGDVHVGDRVTSYELDGETTDMHHRGSANVDTFLERLGPTFHGADRVFVAGSSAGGFGAQLNFHRFASTFDEAEVHVLSDSAPLVQPEEVLFDEWTSAWGVSTPADCEPCRDGFPQWFDYLTDSYPDSRFALLSYENDQIIRLFFGYPVGSSFRQSLRTFVDDHVKPAERAHAYLVEGGQHVLMVDGLGTQDAVGSHVGDWLQRWVDGDAAWTSVDP